MLARREAAERTAHRLAPEVEALRAEGLTSHADIACALTEREVPAPGAARSGRIRLWHDCSLERRCVIPDRRSLYEMGLEANSVSTRKSATS